MELLKKKKDKKPKANGIELNVDTTGMSEEEIAAMEAAKVLEQYDRESAFRNGLPKGISLVISAILIAFALFQIYTSIWTIPAQVLRSVHLAFALTLVFLLYPAGKHMAKNKVQWSLRYLRWPWYCTSLSTMSISLRMWAITPLWI